MTEPATTAIDPVGGMTVDPATARAAGLSSEHERQRHFFCARGCKLDFEEEPARYLDRTRKPRTWEPR